MVALVLLSCKQEGCTNEAASNYNSEASENDGSCVYESKTSFWFNQTTASFLLSYGVTELTLYIDDVSSGTMDPADWKAGPDCDGENFTIVNDLGGLASGEFSYSVRDQAGTQQFYGTYTSTANACQNIQLNW